MSEPGTVLFVAYGKAVIIKNCPARHAVGAATKLNQTFKLKREYTSNLMRNTISSELLLDWEVKAKYLIKPIEHQTGSLVMTCTLNHCV